MTSQLAEPHCPSISIVTCSFNQDLFLEAAIKSVLFQNYPNLEYIIIDGGSSDKSKIIIEKYAQELAYWVSEPDRGQSDALIKGFSHATGDIMGWLCSDDLLEPGALTEVAEIFAANPQIEVIYGDALWIDEQGRTLRAKKEHAFNRFIWLHDHNYLPQPATFWRRGVYEKVGGLDPSFDLAMDADLWIRFAEVAPIHHVRRTFARMRFYPEQKNQRLRQASNEEDRRIRQRYVSGKSDMYMKLANGLARCMRVSLKLVNRCYSLSHPRQDDR
jgi:glycosyltransferase involved in cell wall biosynthesis